MPFQNISLNQPQAEYESIGRRRQLAEALFQKSMEPVQSVSPNASLSWTQGLAKMLQAYGARQDINKAEAEQKALGEEQQHRQSADIALLAQALQGRQAQPAGLSEDVAGNVTQNPGLPAQTPVQSLSQAIPMMSSGMQPLALQTMVGAQGREDQQAFQASQAEENRKAREALFKLQSGERDMRLSSEQQFRTDQQSRDQAFREQQARQAATDREALVSMQTQATANKPPPGYRPTQEGNLEAIPGGPADMKLQGQFNQDTAVLTNTESALDRLATAANEVMLHPGVGRITGLAGKVPNVPGMAGADAAAKLQTLKAQVGFNVLQEMRNASKTGGALGQVTEKELGFLQNALSALDTAQSEDQFKESLQKIIDYAAGAKTRLRGAFNIKHGGRQQEPYTGPERRAPQGLPQGVTVRRVQ